MLGISVRLTSWLLSPTVRDPFPPSSHSISSLIIDLILNSVDMKSIVSKMVLLKAKILFSDILSVNSPNIQAYVQKEKKKTHLIGQVSSTTGYSLSVSPIH